ncbi:MAG: amidase family protein [Paracoccaceae bacterium]
MATKEFWQMSAVEVAKATRSGELSAEAVTRSTIDRMHAVNPSLNAVVADLSQEALERAHALDKARNSGQDTGPLHGVPVTIKVNIDQVGWATTNGITALKDAIATENAPIVQNLLDAGAVVIGRTNTPEFSFRADTDNPLHGRTHNPWGRHVSAGGSSGGAGSAVMAGIGALAHGNDIGGSLRFPAAANGAVTVKPGLGRIAAWNPSQTAERGALAQLMSVQGLITRSAADLDLSMPTAMANDPRDPFHVNMPFRQTPPSGPCKVAFCKDVPGFNVHDDVLKALDAAAEALRDAGYEIEEKEPPHLKETATIGYQALMGEVNALMFEDIRTNGSAQINQIFDEYFVQTPPFEGDDLLKMMAKRTYYAREWSLFLAEYPLILSPFLPQPFFRPGRDTEGSEGVREAIGSALWSYSMNFIGQPAGNLPTRLAELTQGTQPINVQLIGQRWREDMIVDAMMEIEKRIPPLCTALWARMGES